jgi:thymidine phosphorylase
MVVVELGGGRTKPSDTINPAVGISDILPLGVRVEKGEPIAVVHAASSEDAERAIRRIEDCYGIADSVPEIAAPILERIT